MATRQPTDNQHDTTPGPDEPRWGTGAAIGAVFAVLLLVLGVFAAVRLLGDDETSTSTPTSTSTSASASVPESTEPSAEPTDADTSDSAELDKQWQRDAVKASRAGLAAMVPSQLPEGWAVESGTFDEAAMTWSMAFTSPTGPVALEQGQGEATAMAETYVGSDARPDGKLDLSNFGTGEWQVWSGSDSVGISLELESSTVVLVGADEATVEALAQTLITAEDAPVGGNDG